MTKEEKDILNIKLELTTVIMGYENELLKCERKEISEFSKGCMERYYDLIRELKEFENE
jgi:hypothetical protein